MRTTREEEQPDQRQPIELPSFQGSPRGFQPGIDIDDADGLLNLMEQDTPLDKRR